jgi:hypothetical protein
VLARFVNLSRMRRPRIASGVLAAGSALLILLSAQACSRLGGDADGDGVPDRADQCPESPAAREVDTQGCSDVAQAVARGIEALLLEPSFQVGDIWVLQQLIHLQPHAGLARLVEWWTGELEPNPFLRQIDPAAAYAALPPDPGRGIWRFYHYVLAPFGLPESRALEFLRDFVRREATGYVLTHQLLAIEWAKEQGLALPETVIATRPELLGRIAAEQAADGTFSDLFAERAALLIRFAEPTPAESSAWIDTLLTAQLPDGSWQDFSHTVIDFDGERAPTMQSRAHTTAWTELALVAFLHGH